jgi:hypothetical protein
MSLVAALHADLDDIEARLKSMYNPEIARLREIEADVTRVVDIRNAAGIHAGGLQSKLEALAGHLPVLHMFIDNLHRDHPDADSAAPPAPTTSSTAPVAATTTTEA